jgi:hypothetical protein
VTVAEKICTVPDCGRDTSKGGHGHCGMHYARVRRGTPAGGPGYLQRPGRTLAERLEDFTDNTGPGCWEWTGALRNGYGVLGDGAKVLYAHRVAYELAHGPIPAGKVIDHLCVNRSCVRPAHMDVVTRGENNRRGGHEHGARSRGEEVIVGAVRI